MPTLLVFLLAVSVACADELGDEISGLNITLPTGRTLSSNDLRQVLQFAHAAGMKRVSEIRPANAFGEPGLFISSKEVLEGRRVSRQELTMWNDDWRPDGSAKKSERFGSLTAMTFGKFSIDRQRAYTREWATFTIQGKEVRLECGRDTDLSLADNVFAALAAGRVTYESKDVKSKFSEFQHNAPIYISVRNGAVQVGFRHTDRLCDYAIFGKLKGNTVVVETASTFCA